MLSYRNGNFIRLTLQDTKRFWEVLRARRANCLGDKFWRPPKPVFTPRKAAIRMGLCDANGNLTRLCEQVLALDTWEAAKGILEAHYKQIVDQKDEAERKKLETMVEEKREFKPLQVIPYAQWKWPWIYISRIYHKRPNIHRSQYDNSPYVYFPPVFKDDPDYKHNWKVLIEIGWINQLGEVREDIVAALKEREKRLLESGGIITGPD